MFDIEKHFYEIQIKKPLEGQKVIVYSNKFDKFFDAEYKNGKFYSNNIVVLDVSRWKEINNNIEFS
jgi:hypothetical protein